MHHLLYHAQCADGFAAATIAHRALILQGIPEHDIRTQAVNYSDALQMPPADTLKNSDHIYYLDYTPPSKTLELLLFNIDTLNWSDFKVTIIDHHSTADERHAKMQYGFTSVFDLTKSGALLTFEHFHPKTVVPDGIQLISWRDLGHAFQQPHHRYTQPAFDLHATLMRLTARTHAAWEPILFTHSTVLLGRDLEVGQRLRLADRNIIAAAAMNPLWLAFPSIVVPASAGPASEHVVHASACSGSGTTVNNSQPPSTAQPSTSPVPIPALTGLGPEIMSEALAEVLTRHPSTPFAASWYVHPSTGHFTYSLRSRKDGPNVAEIAKALHPDGGGHPTAAGFTLDTPIPLAAHL